MLRFDVVHHASDIYLLDVDQSTASYSSYHYPMIFLYFMATNQKPPIISAIFQWYSFSLWQPINSLLPFLSLSNDTPWLYVDQSTASYSSCHYPIIFLFFMLTNQQPTTLLTIIQWYSFTLWYSQWYSQEQMFYFYTWSILALHKKNGVIYMMCWHKKTWYPEKCSFFAQFWLKL